MKTSSIDFPAGSVGAYLLLHYRTLGRFGKWAHLPWGLAVLDPAFVAAAGLTDPILPPAMRAIVSSHAAMAVAQEVFLESDFSHDPAAGVRAPNHDRAVEGGLATEW